MTEAMYAEARKFVSDAQMWVTMVRRPLVFEPSEPRMLPERREVALWTLKQIIEIYKIDKTSAGKSLAQAISLLMLPPTSFFGDAMVVVSALDDPNCAPIHAMRIWARMNMDTESVWMALWTIETRVSRQCASLFVRLACCTKCLNHKS